MNKKCPISGMPVNPEHTLNLLGFRIGFCSEKHRRRVKSVAVLAAVVVVALALL